MESKATTRRDSLRHNTANALNLDNYASQLLQHQLPDNWHLEDGALWYNLNRLYIPEALRIKAKELSHDSPLAGHWGIARTTDLAQRNYYWPGRTQDIHNYVAGCQLCAQDKSKTHKKHGKLSPLPIPEGRWSRVAMGFITDLPKTKNGNTAILTCIDAATKRGRFIPCKLAGLTAEKTAILIHKNLIRQHGIPKLFITDRGQQFINKFWKQLGSTMAFQNISTTTAHQQGNGLAERIIQPIESYLRAYFNLEQNNWDEHLDLCEFSWNNSKHATTGLTPFYVDQGYLPNALIIDEQPGNKYLARAPPHIPRSSHNLPIRP
ncbi:hypothetical protein K3495_g5156 [Podosphaera aphanis]|nr:hypothetical protein K3495_g5156 [Podosphaera aphanis]